MEKFKKGVDCIGVSAVCFCHDGKGRHVMMRRSQNARDEHGRWDFPAGGLDFGETVENTIRREIQEEICTDVLNIEFLGFRDVHREQNDNMTHWIALDFKVLINPEKVGNGEPHKFDEVKWFTMDTFPENLHSQMHIFLEKYKRRLV